MRSHFCSVCVALVVIACSPSTPLPMDSGFVDTGDTIASDSAVESGTTSDPDAGRDAGGDVAAFVRYTGPDDYCPGSAHCATEGDGVLYVGAARELINPTLVESAWTDSNNNGLYESGEPFVDLNGNGLFDATWIAGFSSSRPATGMHDDLEARALALRSGDTLVAVVSLDIVGLFRDDIERIRSHSSLQELGIDHVIVASTHLHEGVDTVGLWGRSATESGVNRTYQTLVVERAARAVRSAVLAARQPNARALIRVAQTPTANAMMDTRDYVSDTRDPVIFDPTLTLVQFVRDDASRETIATWVNWAAHPEYTGSRNNLLSADYVHTLRETLERGDTGLGLAGVGGTTVFVNGALGGQVGPGDAAPLGRDNMPVRMGGFAKAEACGLRVAQLGLEALETARRGDNEGLVVGPTPVRYRTARTYARVTNRLYWLGFQFRVLARELTNFNRNYPPGMSNVPWVESRVSYLQVGPVATITAPGELHPELWIGSADMRWSWGQPRVTETENPPDFGRAPPPPYLRDDMLANPEVRYAFVSGLAQDFLGYIVADWNFALHPTSPYLSRAAGHHYEETNSIGPDSQEHLFGPMVSLARWRAPAR